MTKRKYKLKADTLKSVSEVDKCQPTSSRKKGCANKTRNDGAITTAMGQSYKKWAISFLGTTKIDPGMLKTLGAISSTDKRYYMLDST